MVSFLQSFVLCWVAAAVSLLAPSLAAPNGARELRLVPRDDPPDWGNYVYISSIFSGLVGQNLALISLPANRAVCPLEVWNLQSCSGAFTSECLDERDAFEWCLLNRLPIDTGCGTEWVNTTIQCTGGDAPTCTSAIEVLHDACWGVTIPPMPT